MDLDEKHQAYLCGWRLRGLFAEVCVLLSIILFIFINVTRKSGRTCVENFTYSKYIK